jgi:hypothetical protein
MKTLEITQNEEQKVKVSKEYEEAYMELKKMEKYVERKLKKIRDAMTYKEFCQIVQHPVEIKSTIRRFAFDMKYNIDTPEYYETNVVNNPNLK